MPLRRLILMLFVYCLGFVVSQDALALRCQGGLVNVGDNKLTVLNKCGDPDWTDRWSEEIVNFPDTDQEHRITNSNERWIYNPGPNQFINIVIFTGSTVSAIQTGGRGFSVPPGKPHCDLDALPKGITSPEVTSRCGEPDLKDGHSEMITHKISGGRQQVSITVDEWTYNLGPTSFMRTLIFHNGNLVEIRSGERGFSR